MPLWNLCRNGHLADFKDQQGEPFPSMADRPQTTNWTRCGFCHERFVWETRDGRAVTGLTLLEAKIVKICDMGHEHLLSPNIFEIPKEGRLKPFVPSWECGSGWKGLIDPLIAECARLDINIEQIKEKFGGLRFYIEAQARIVTTAGAGSSTHRDETILLMNMIEKAEEASLRTCELCGAAGSLSDRKKRSWIKTLCPAHLEWWHEDAAAGVDAILQGAQNGESASVSDGHPV